MILRETSKNIPLILYTSQCNNRFIIQHIPFQIQELLVTCTWGTELTTKYCCPFVLMLRVLCTVLSEGG